MEGEFPPLEAQGLTGGPLAFPELREVDPRFSSQIANS